MALDRDKVFLLDKFLKLNNRLVTPTEDKEFYSWIVQLKRTINTGKLSKDDYTFVSRVVPVMLVEGGIREVSQALRNMPDKSFSKEEWYKYCKEYPNAFSKEDYYLIKFLEKLVGPNIVSEIIRYDLNANSYGMYNTKYLKMGILYSFSKVPYKTAYIITERYGLIDGVPKDYKWLTGVLINSTPLDCFSFEYNGIFTMSRSDANPVNFLEKEHYQKLLRSEKIPFELRVKEISMEEFVRRLKSYIFYDSIQKLGR